MWRCESWIGGFFPGGIVFFLIWGLIILAVVFPAIKLFGMIRSGKGEQRIDRIDSLNILKDRFAKGNISEKEYINMKEVLCD